MENYESFIFRKVLLKIISLINKDGLITENEDLAKTFNNFFSNIVNKLGIEHVPVMSRIYLM